MNRRILVLLDGSPIAEEALPHAVARARAEGAELRLLQLVRPGLRPRLPGSNRESERAAWLYLETVAQRLQSQDVHVTCQVRRGQLGCLVSEASRADLLFAATRSVRLLRRLLGQTAANKLMSRAGCPLVPVEPSTETPGGRVRSFSDDAGPYESLAQRPLGHRLVPVDRIVGSVGRAQDLAADFLPRHGAAGYRRDGSPRYQWIRDAMERGERLPPVELYKLADRYYALDGNHRVAAAKSLQRTEIEAFVIEFLPIEDADAHRVFAERRAFEEATELTALDATRPGHYPRLQEMIQSHADAEHLDIRDGARRWYHGVYLPVSARLEAVRLDSLFPGDRAGDLFVYLTDLRSAEEEFLGHEVSWDEAVETMLARYRSCRRHTRLRLPEFQRFLRRTS